MKITDNFCTKMDERNFHYERDVSENGREMVKLGLSGEHFTSLIVYIFFLSETEAQLKCFNVCKFTEEKNLVILQTVNKLNIDYRLVKFTATPEGTVTASIDVVAAEDTVADIVFCTLSALHSILDDTYPLLMKALYI